MYTLPKTQLKSWFSFRGNFECYRNPTYSLLQADSSGNCGGSYQGNSITIQTKTVPSTPSWTYESKAGFLKVNDNQNIVGYGSDGISYVSLSNNVMVLSDQYSVEDCRADCDKGAYCKGF